VKQQKVVGRRQKVDDSGYLSIRRKAVFRESMWPFVRG
jgi:hypothetical protein